MGVALVFSDVVHFIHLSSSIGHFSTTIGQAEARRMCVHDSTWEGEGGGVYKYPPPPTPPPPRLFFTPKSLYWTVPGLKVG